MDQSLDELQAHWAFYLYIVYYVYFYLQNRWMGTPMCECVCVCVVADGIVWLAILQ